MQKQIIVLSGHNNPGAFEKLNFRRIQKWASDNNYDVHIEIDNFYFMRKDTDSQDGYFARYPLILEYLKLYKYVLWLDADVIPMVNKTLDFIRPDIQLYLSGSAFIANSGVVLYERSEIVNRLLSEIILMRVRRDNDSVYNWTANCEQHDWDEAYLIKLLSMNWQGLLYHTEFLDPIVWNACLQTKYWHTPNLPYLDYDKEKTVFLHLAGMSKDEKQEYIQLGLLVQDL